MRAIQSLLILIIVAVSCLISSGCETEYTQERAVSSILAKVDFPAEGGAWPDRSGTLDLWAKVPSKWRSEEADGYYRTFGTFIERSYYSLKSCAKPPVFVRVRVQKADWSWLFTVPFDTVETYHRGDAPVRDFWNDVLIETDSSVETRHTNGVTVRDIASGLAAQDIAQAAYQIGILDLKVTWNSPEKMFSVVIQSKDSLGEDLVTALHAAVSDACAKRAERFGFDYWGIEFLQELGNEAKPAVVRYSKGALSRLRQEKSRKGQP